MPMMVMMPGTIPAGATNNEAIHPVDFYKTYASFANATLPAAATHALDGESFVDILTGGATNLTRESIFYHFPGYSAQNSPMSIAIHDGFDGNRYKLTYFYEDRSFEFYDLTNDIGETTELIESGMTDIQFEVSINARTELTNWLVETGADLLTVRATGETVPLPSHSPDVEYDLGTGGFGATLDGQASGTADLHGILMTMTAEGSNPVLGADASGIGVNSDLDTGGATARRRIDGSLTTPEGIVVSFDEDVILKQLSTFAFNGDGSESLQVQFVSGDNPFTGLSGYDSDGFSVTNDALTFTRTDGSNGGLPVRYGRLDQDEILIKSGTTLRLTANPATGGGILLNSISVALPAALPEVVSVAIDDGTAQRSAVETITLTFDGAVDIDADAISIVQLSDIDGLTGTPVDSSFTSSTSGGQTVVNVTFDSLTRNGAGQLIDGNYQLTVDGQKVRLDGLQMAEDFIFGSLVSDGFYSFYGDSNGDRTVNIFDLLAFRLSFRAASGDAGYDFSMDFEANGVVNIFDLLQFRNRYLRTLPFSFASSQLKIAPAKKSVSTPVLKSRR